MVVDHGHVSRLLEEMKRDFEGFHRRINEVESIRYMEDKLNLPGDQTPTGIEVRIGATAELIENVKSALTAGIIKVKFTPLRSGPAANENSSNREKCWQYFLKWCNRPVKVVNELADAQVGTGVGILKGAYYPWPKTERKQKKGEADRTYNSRMKNQKRLWGPPFRVVTVHPLSFYWRLGAGNQISEAVENSYKPKREVFSAYGLNDGKLDEIPRTLDQAHIPATVEGKPDETIRPLPYGTDTTTMALVTEYYGWDEQAQCYTYQMYVDGRLVYDEDHASIYYCLAPGRTTSSKDPDKFGFSVAELLRHNEPTINRSLTRMAEATELQVRKRLTLETPEGFIPEMELGEDNNQVPKVYQFKPDSMEALPAGSSVVDPFEGSENVYGAMPMIQMLMQVLGQHGVSPIFKGASSGSNASGYKDNSLYMMAQNQFNYIVESLGDAITDLIKWCEYQVVFRAQQEVFFGENSLKPSDIEDYPCEIEVIVDPAIPTNVIGEGQFWDRMHERGHVTRRFVRETGLRLEQPEKMESDMMEEKLQELLEPQLYQDVLIAVGAAPPISAQQQSSGLVGPDGQPLPPSSPTPTNGITPNQAAVNTEIGNSVGGMTTGGQARQPNTQPGTVEGGY